MKWLTVSGQKVPGHNIADFGNTGHSLITQNVLGCTIHTLIFQYTQRINIKPSVYKLNV